MISFNKFKEVSVYLGPSFPKLRKMSDSGQNSSQIELKLFMGFLLSSELRMHVNQRDRWKDQSFNSSFPSSYDLQEVHYQGKEYFGFYLNEKELSLPALKERQNEIQQRLSTCCPQLQKEDLNIFIFPQLFIA